MFIGPNKKYFDMFISNFDVHVPTAGEKARLQRRELERKKALKATSPTLVDVWPDSKEARNV